MLKMIKKKFLRKMLIGIKDDRDSMTRQENLQKKKDMDSDQIGVFFSVIFPQSFYCAYFGNKE